MGDGYIFKKPVSTGSFRSAEKPRAQLSRSTSSLIAHNSETSMCDIHPVLFAVMVVSLFTFTTCLSDEELFKKHKATNSRHKCGKPQARVFAYKDLLPEDQWPSACEVIIPHVSVLHRCDFESGCCDADFRSCQPVQNDEVTLVYQVLRKTFKSSNTQCSDDLNGLKARYVHVLATNHTQCRCRSKNNQPKK